MLRLLHDLRVRCPYHKTKRTSSLGSQDTASSSSAAADDGKNRPCPKEETADGCSWRGCYGDIDRHMRLCQLHMIVCPHGCGKEFQRHDLAAHEIECESNLILCTICGEKVRPHAKALHDSTKAEQHVFILQERLKVSDNVSDQLLTVTKDLRSMQLSIAALSSARITRGPEMKGESVWRITDIASVLRSRTKGYDLRSPIFPLGWINGFSLQFYPNGSASSQPGNFGLFLRTTPGWRIEANLIAAGETKILTHDFLIKDENWGYHDFGLISAVPPDGTFEIGVQLLSAIYIA